MTYSIEWDEKVLKFLEKLPKNISDLEKALQEVRQDIPDAKILVFSHWI